MKRKRAAARPAGPAAPAAPVPAPAPRWDELSFAERMDLVEFRVSARPHITVDSDVCRSCTTRACVTTCPAGLFTPVSGGGILFNYEQCFECGACYQVCNSAGAITWSYPGGGDGVVFRYG